jgi:hypothetical protein
VAFLEPSGFQDMRENFAAQFKDEAGKLVYRKNGFGEGIIVSLKERDDFIEDFNKYVSKIKWYFFAVIFLVLLLPFAFSIILELEEAGFYMMFLIFFAAFVAWFGRSISRAMAAPAAALADRQPARANLTRSEVERDWLKKQDWSTFVLGPAIAMLLSYRMDVFEAPFALDRIFWTMMSIGILLLFAVQAVRKWIIEKEDRVKDR